MNGQFEFTITHFRQICVSCFITNLRTGRISSNLKKKNIFFQCGRNLRVGKIVINFK